MRRAILSVVTSHHADFCEVLDWCLLIKYAEKIYLWLKWGKNIVSFVWGINCIYYTNCTLHYVPNVIGKIVRKLKYLSGRVDLFFEKPYRLRDNYEKYGRTKRTARCVSFCCHMLCNITGPQNVRNFKFNFHI
jgi:hypothetical protein